MPPWNNAPLEQRPRRSALSGSRRARRPPASGAQVYVLSTDQQPLNRRRLL